MLNDQALAQSGGQMIQLNDDQLAGIVGGLGPLGRILGELGSVLWECVRTGIDDVIDAAKEGYEDNRG